MRRTVHLLLILTATAGVALAADRGEWLAICAQCLNPSVSGKSGIGTAKATVEGRVTRADAEAWCAQYSPRDRNCVKDQLASEAAKRSFRATADCSAGRITAIDGVTYTLSGVWSSDAGKGRTRWRDPAGKIVGQDRASNGLAISQQWELLCPGVTKAEPSVPVIKAAPPAAGAAPAFAVGQKVEAKFGRDWIRGEVIRIQQSQGAAGPLYEYEVVLENGHRGSLPARMLRKAEKR
jgi:hypothetical protein